MPRKKKQPEQANIEQHETINPQPEPSTYVPPVCGVSSTLKPFEQPTTVLPPPPPKPSTNLWLGIIIGVAVVIGIIFLLALSSYVLDDTIDTNDNTIQDIKDKGFLKWCPQILDESSDMADTIVPYLDSSDFDQVAITGRQYYNTIEDWKLDLKQFSTVSQKYQFLYNQFEEYLDNLALSFYYCYRGAEDMNAGYFTTSSDYISKAKINLDAITDYIDVISP